MPGALAEMSIEMPATTPTRSVATILRVVAIGAALAILVWLLSEVLLLAFFAALLAILLSGVAGQVSSRLGLSRGWALALVLVVLVAACCGAAAWAGAGVEKQVEQLARSLSQEGDSLSQSYGQSAAGRWVFGHLSSARPSGRPLVAAAGSTLDLVGSLLVLVITALYFAASPGLYVGGAVRLVPMARRPRARQILGDVGRTLWLWLLGQGVDMVVVGVLAGVGLWLVGVPLAILLGAITGLLTFIPYFGAIAASVPAVLMGLSVSGRTALWALGVFVLCHVVEGYVIAPLVQKRMVDLPPAVTILSLAVFGALFGPLGAILGTPLAAAALVVVQKAYVVDVLGDAEMEHPGATG